MSRNVDTDADVHAAAIRWLLPIGALTAFAMAVAAPFVLARLYGAGFAPVIPLLHWLLPGAVAFSLIHVVSPALIQRGKAQDISLASVTGLVVQVGLILWLVPTGGAGSAAIATLAAYGVSATMVILAYSRDTGRPLQRVLLPTRADVHAAARRLRRRATR